MKGLVKKHFRIILAGFLVLSMLATSGIALASDDNHDFSFDISSYYDNSYSDERYRQTDSTNNDWKVDLSYSSEGAGTITNFWLHKGSDRVSEYYSVKQGSGAHYYPAYSTANESDVKLGAENNNYSANTYYVSGYWDEETW
ncbi:DUF2712 domain-containing protein [Alkalibacillus almallahensis]|uniref:DUF2712 domain-containing protein n=1 Tax=Alkalibacillus almallahensis TaxID=1379154 RepID=UPI00141F6107|nr:DUF2712 domain-containing protein [Alkalibacillus almallahensis]NIK13411.1 hypothetical protein [Alkalibacillus almallahensis]